MKCPALMNGYHNRPDVPPPFTQDGFYITGDVLRRDDNGFHYFVGRTDDMFVSGGENIYPTDVERMLEKHPDVGQAVVMPVDDDIKGTKPVAFVIPKAGHKPTEAAIKKYALENAPAYQHPRFVWFIDELPLASTNKVDRDALRKLAQERVAARPRLKRLQPDRVDHRLPARVLLGHVLQRRVRRNTDTARSRNRSGPFRTPALPAAFLVASARRSTTARASGRRVDAEEELSDHVRHALFDGGRDIRRGLQPRSAS